MNRGRLARTFWIGAAAILVAAALISIGSIVRGQFSETDGKILGTLAALLYTGGAAIAGLALADRGYSLMLGSALAAVAVVAFVTLAWTIWANGGDIGGLVAPSALVLVGGGLFAATALLVAQRPTIVRLARVTGSFAAVAAALALVEIWGSPGSEWFHKALATACILTGASWALGPVLQRFSAVGEPDDAERILGTLDDVELVAVRGRVPEDAVDVRLRSGEHAVLRRAPATDDTDDTDDRSDTSDTSHTRDTTA